MVRQVQSVVLACALLLVPAAVALASTGSASGAKVFFYPAGHASGATGASTSDLVWHGGHVEHAPKVYLVFWGWGSVANPIPPDPSHEADYLIRFFEGIGGTGWANIQTQYTDAAGAITNPTSQLAGVWWDNSTLPPTVPDEYIATEAANAANHFGYSPDADYFIALPSQHWNEGNLPNVATGYYCGYHSTTTDGHGHVVAYTDMPYLPDFNDFGTVAGGCGARSVNAGSAGLMDGVSIVAGHEYAEAATDPGIDGWIAPSGAETGDLCAWHSSGPGAMFDLHTSTGTFAVQGLWSNAAHGCVQAYP